MKYCALRKKKKKRGDKKHCGQRDAARPKPNLLGTISLAGMDTWNDVLLLPLRDPCGGLAEEESAGEDGTTTTIAVGIGEEEDEEDNGSPITITMEEEEGEATIGSTEIFHHLQAVV